jgi:hypothetical protein
LLLDLQGFPLSKQSFVSVIQQFNKTTAESTGMRGTSGKF